MRRRALRFPSACKISKHSSRPTQTHSTRLSSSQCGPAPLVPCGTSHYAKRVRPAAPPPAAHGSLLPRRRSRTHRSTLRLAIRSLTYLSRTTRSLAIHSQAIRQRSRPRAHPSLATHNLAIRQRSLPQIPNSATRPRPRPRSSSSRRTPRPRRLSSSSSSSSSTSPRLSSWRRRASPRS